MKKIIGTTLALALAIVIPISVSAQTVNLTPGTVTQGNSVTVSGSCSGAGTVNISVVGSGVTQTATTTANASGNFSATVALPSNFPAGTAVVTATCPNGSATVSSNLVVNTPPGSTITLGGTPILGQGLTVSGSCGATAAGGMVNISLVRTNSSISLGSTTTVNASGDFSGTFTIPANAGGGPVTIVATCLNGTVTLNSSIVDPSAQFVSADASPSIGSSFTVSGVCGTTAGGSVSFTLSNPSAQVILGTTQTTANGSYSAVLSVPSGFPTGSALLVATCPTGNVVLRTVVVDPSITGGTVVIPPSADTGDEGAVGGVGEEDTTPTGGVAAGSASLSLIAALSLLTLGAIGMYANRKRQQESSDDITV